MAPQKPTGSYFFKELNEYLSYKEYPILIPLIKSNPPVFARRIIESSERSGQTVGMLLAVLEVDMEMEEAYSQSRKNTLK